MVASKYTVPSVPDGPALGEADGLTLGLWDLLSLLDGDAEPDGDSDVLLLALGLLDGDADADGLRLMLVLPLGLALPEGEADPLGLPLMLALGLTDLLTDAETDAEGLRLALLSTAKLTWMPRRARPATPSAAPSPASSAAFWNV